MAYEEHKFFCPICGREGIPLRRKTGHRHSKFHRKKLYCLNCKAETNHIEIMDDEQEKIFFNNLKEGVYKDEQPLPVDFVWNSRFGKNH